MSGAYQAGVLAGLIQNLPADEVAYDAVSGVASGAVNAAILSSFAKGSEQDAVTKIQEFWTEAATTELYKDWLGGLAQGLLLEGGLYNTAPLEKFLKAQFPSSTTLYRDTTIGVVDLIQGKYSGMSETDLADSSDLVNALYASLSSVGFYPPVEAFGSSFVDGAAVYDIDIPAAINYCTEQGFAEANIVVDVIMTKSSTLDYEDTSEYNSLKMLFRFLQIARYYGIMDGLKRSEFAYPEANFRYVIGPSTKLPHNFEPLKFDATDMQTMYDLGVQDA